MDASGGWMAFGACLDADPELFTANMEAEEPDPRAVAICDLCPVQVECQEHAHAKGLWGTWAGTSHHQRRQLKRRYRRRDCPRCHRADGVVEVEGNAQVCRWCAQSWRATPARQAAP